MTITTFSIERRDQTLFAELSADQLLRLLPSWTSRFGIREMPDGTTVTKIIDWDEDHDYSEGLSSLDAAAGEEGARARSHFGAKRWHIYMYFEAARGREPDRRRAVGISTKGHDNWGTRVYSGGGTAEAEFYATKLIVDSRIAIAEAEREFRCALLAGQTSDPERS